ncbi:MAG: hypothetical protein RL177_1136, partial [Bacteroidota bacterium]
MFRESVFQNRATLKWEPQKSKKTGILLLHGYAEHARRYRTFGDRMAGEGYHVFAIDHVGHGKSPGRPGYIASFDAMKEDTIAYFDFLRQSYLLTASHFMEAAHQLDGLEPAEKAKAQFLIKQFVDAMSPSNFALTNPEVLKTTAETGG